MGGAAGYSVAVTLWDPKTPLRSLIGGFCCLLLCCYMVRVPSFDVPLLLSITNVFFLYTVTSFFITFSCSLAMFYVIALAGAHKRVINQLREQLVMVGFTQHFDALRDTKWVSLEFKMCVYSLSTRRAVTSVSSSRSCARLRRAQLSDLQCLTHAAAAAAAPAITPASPTISMKASSWHTRLLILPHMCETQLHIQGPGRYSVAENCVNLYLLHISIMFVFSFFLLCWEKLGNFCGPTFISTHETWETLTWDMRNTNKTPTILKHSYAFALNGGELSNLEPKRTLL